MRLFQWLRRALGPAPYVPMEPVAILRARLNREPAFGPIPFSLGLEFPELVAQLEALASFFREHQEPVAMDVLLQECRFPYARAALPVLAKLRRLGLLDQAVHVNLGDGAPDRVFASLMDIPLTLTDARGASVEVTVEDHLSLWYTPSVAWSASQ